MKPLETFTVEEAKEIIKKTVFALVDIRDFLGYQLNHAWGNIPDKHFNEIEKKYLKPAQKIDHDELVKGIFILIKYLDIDPEKEIELIGDIFNCNYPAIHDAIKDLLLL